MKIIAFDSHKRYTFARVENQDGSKTEECRIEHRRGSIAGFLWQQPPGCLVAVETIGNWYWIIDQIEQAGMVPQLVHARKAKMMFGCINKTDKLDAKGLNMLQLDQTEQKIQAIEARMKELLKETEQHRLLETMPGVGFILAVVILQEVGDIKRFSSAERFASYCGVTPRVHASGGKVRYGRLRPDTNHYLKWAFSEAGNSVAVNRNRFPARHVSQLYHRIRHRKDHAKAVGAVARHLAEATYWILTKGQAYRDQGVLKVSSTGA